jgi:hypothetical protein
MAQKVWYVNVERLSVLRNMKNINWDNEAIGTLDLDVPSSINRQQWEQMKITLSKNAPPNCTIEKYGRYRLDARFDVKVGTLKYIQEVTDYNEAFNVTPQTYIPGIYRYLIVFVKVTTNSQLYTPDLKMSPDIISQLRVLETKLDTFSSRLDNGKL